MDLKRRFGRVLRSLRIEREMSQEELAFAAKLNTTYVSDLERGLYNPTLQVVFDLSKALGEHPATIIQKMDVAQPTGRRRGRP